MFRMRATVAFAVSPSTMTWVAAARTTNSDRGSSLPCRRSIVSCSPDTPKSCGGKHPDRSLTLNMYTYVSMHVGAHARTHACTLTCTHAPHAPSHTCIHTCSVPARRISEGAAPCLSCALLELPCTLPDLHNTLPELLGIFFFYIEFRS